MSKQRPRYEIPKDYLKKKFNPTDRLSQSPSNTKFGAKPKVDFVGIEQQNYFHGVLPRDEVACLLKKNGDFVVRETRKGGQSQIVISVLWDTPHHYIIQSDLEGFCLENAHYQTVPDLIDYYVSSGLSLTSATNARLINPIIKEKWQLSNDDVKLGQRLGKGNFGEVYSAIFYDPFNHCKPIEVAVKTCKDTMPEDEKQAFLKEAKIMRKWSHPNIVKLIGVAATKEPMMIIMELVKGGCLTNYLKKNLKTKKPDEEVYEKTKFCLHAATGMEYLANHNCLHRDLAARNCLLELDNNLKISDFGMSREGSIYVITRARQMPVKWCAPEIFTESQFLLKSDVWSFGILMWEIFTDAATPYPGIPNKDIIEHVTNGGHMTAPEKMPKPLAELMLKTWDLDPDTRPPFTTIKPEIETFLKSLSHK